jgi:hypothetical protein
MKVIIDLIEDIRAAIDNDSSFFLSAMALNEDENAAFTPVWQSDINQYKIDDEKNRIYFFLGQGDALNIGHLLKELNALDNKKMMYEVVVSYLKENRRIDAPLLGFGESFEEKKYRLFISEN